MGILMSREGVTFRPLQARCQKVPSCQTMSLLLPQTFWATPPSL